MERCRIHHEWSPTSAPSTVAPSSPIRKPTNPIPSCKPINPYPTYKSTKSAFKNLQQIMHCCTVSIFPILSIALRKYMAVLPAKYVVSIGQSNILSDSKKDYKLIHIYIQNLSTQSFQAISVIYEMIHYLL